MISGTPRKRQPYSLLHLRELTLIYITKLLHFKGDNQHFGYQNWVGRQLNEVLTLLLIGLVQFEVWYYAWFFKWLRQLPTWTTFHFVTNWFIIRKDNNNIVTWLRVNLSLVFELSSGSGLEWRACWRDVQWYIKLEFRRWLTWRSTSRW